MKILKKLSALCITAIMVMTVSACAPTTTSEGTGGYIDDTVVTTKVKAALLGEKNLKSSDISVETFKGRVQLSGFVNSVQAADRAVKVTRVVPGVRSVSNQMLIK